MRPPWRASYQWSAVSGAMSNTSRSRTRYSSMRPSFTFTRFSITSMPGVPRSVRFARSTTERAASSKPSGDDPISSFTFETHMVRSSRRARDLAAGALLAHDAALFAQHVEVADHLGHNEVDAADSERRGRRDSRDEAEAIARGEVVAGGH